MRIRLFTSTWIRIRRPVWWCWSSSGFQKWCGSVLNPQHLTSYDTVRVQTWFRNTEENLVLMVPDTFFKTIAQGCKITGTGYCIRMRHDSYGTNLQDSFIGEKTARSWWIINTGPLPPRRETGTGQRRRRWRGGGRPGGGRGSTRLLLRRSGGAHLFKNGQAGDPLPTHTHMLHLFLSSTSFLRARRRNWTIVLLF